MPQPPPYTRTSNLVEIATANPSAPYPPASIDTEFNNVMATLAQTLANLALLQRDDGAPRNGMILAESFGPTALALIGSAGFTIANPVGWLTATAYPARQIVTQGGGTYVSAAAHTSGVFNTDLAAGRWALLYSTTAVSAASVAFTPTGTVAAANVQAAVAEVALEAAQKSANLSDLTNAAAARANLGIQSTESPSFTTAATVVSIAGSNSAGPDLRLDRQSATPADDDYIGLVTFAGRNDAAASRVYAQFNAVMTDVSSGNEGGLLSVSTRYAGTLAERWKIGRGLFSAATLLDPGDGNIDVTGGYYRNGIQIIDTAADKPTMEAGASATRIVTPSQAQNHPSALKAYGKCDVTGTLTPGGYGVASITDLGLGEMRVNLINSFASANACNPWGNAIKTTSSASNIGIVNVSQIEASSFRLEVNNPTTAALADPQVGYTFGAAGALA